MARRMALSTFFALLVLTTFYHCSAVENGKISLAFVFDRTYSMGNELAEMKTGAVHILKEIIDKKGSSLYNFILVPFSDPDVGPITDTRDPEVLKNDLQAIELGATENYDCPEMSLSGIKLALESSLPGSYIYVITDASSKDHYLINDVLDLIQEKKIQVVFILTGNCNDFNEPNYLVYDLIKDTSGGQIFLIKKKQIPIVLKYIEETFDTERRSIGRQQYPRSFNNEYKLEVDKNLNNLSISVPAENAQLEIIDPHGENVGGSSIINKIIDLPNLKIVNILRPEPGAWSIITGGENDYAVQISGISKATFEYGFFTDKISQLNDRPVKGQQYRLAIKLKDGMTIENLNSVLISSTSGRKDQIYPLKRIYDAKIPHLYYTDFITFEDDFFYITIIGNDLNRMPFKRITPTAVQQIKIVAPKKLPDVKPMLQKSEEEINIEIGQSIEIMCIATGRPKPTITWTLPNGTPMRTDKKYEIINDGSLFIKDLNIEDGGEYTCEAKNIAGEAKSYTRLNVGIRPFFGDDIIDRKLTVFSNDRVELECQFGGFPKPTITWYNPDNKKLKSKLVDQKYVYVIKRSQYGHSGEYKCIGENIFGKLSRTTYLSVKGEKREFP